MRICSVVKQEQIRRKKLGGNSSTLFFFSRFFRYYLNCNISGHLVAHLNGYPGFSDAFNRVGQQDGPAVNCNTLFTDFFGNIGSVNRPIQPAFITYPNFDVYFEWNQSFTYVMTAAYFATRLEGAPVYNAGNPSGALSGNQMKALQQKLRARGHDVGAIDGILGAKTRVAVQKEQARLGLVPDAWPTVELLNKL